MSIFLVEFVCTHHQGYLYAVKAGIGWGCSFERGHAAKCFLVPNYTRSSYERHTV
jgi:hypothetical protein